MKRRVVITGIGSVTPLGLTLEETWQGLLAGKSGISPIRLFDASTFPTTFAAQVPDFDLKPYVKDPAPYAKVGRNVRFAMAAARMAFDDAGLAPNAVDRSRFGIYMGSGEGIVDFDTLVTSIARGTQDDGRVNIGPFAEFGLRTYDGLRELEQEPNMPANHLAAEYGLAGPTYSCLTACAASTQAVGEAMDLVRTARVDRMLAGGTHSMIHPLGVTGFNLLTAISTEPKNEPWRASRPFDRDRGGFVLGEGSTILVLEELEAARKRGARILAEMVGFGTSADAYRMTDVQPEGRGAAAAMRMALEDARVGPEEIDYISAHGTGTTENDKVETRAVKLVFGDAAPKVPMSSVKSMLGHLIAAAGATELATCVLAIRDQVLPPTINLDTPDPECDLDYVPNRARKAEVEVCLSNSFGFGGQNDSLVVRRFIP
ncbi:MAG TPA: beta-ketoacyl-[acyl-carrier-protein] synthase family protein [Phycisphaerae bacterium]|nr:beta-ketoacyl-[acyl-carrier-protein] synthase family protein [Phycisphaerae bacterium]